MLYRSPTVLETNAPSRPHSSDSLAREATGSESGGMEGETGLGRGSLGCLCLGIIAVFHQSISCPISGAH